MPCLLVLEVGGALVDESIHTFEAVFGRKRRVEHALLKMAALRQRQLVRWQRALQIHKNKDIS